MENHRFHPSPEQYARQTENALVRAVADGIFTPTEAEHLREFVAEVSATRHITPGRRYKLVYFTISCRRFMNRPYHELTVADLYEGVRALTTARKEDGSLLFKANSQLDMVSHIKRYVLWLIENGYSTIPTEKVRKIRLPKADKMTTTAADLITEDEVRLMIDAARTTKDRAFIACLYESGCRIVEMAKLTWGDVKFEDWCAWINVDEKTGRPRGIPIIMARQYLAAWKAEYPLPMSRDALVFVGNINYKPLKYESVIKQLRIIAKRAGVEKHIRGHIFRHSRITHLLQQGAGETIVKRIAWGGDTRMLERYSHLTDSDTRQALAELAGVAPPEQKRRSKALEPIQCPRCAEINTPGTNFCRKCGLALTEEALEEKTSASSQIWSDPKFRAEHEEAVRRMEAKSL
ncbi:MAG: tyrosine-type recombinase/integrase [Methanospirillum sp.]|nr:tyrosine-type recombinase/integrase [Methanospirillum sp.]